MLEEVDVAPTLFAEIMRPAQRGTADTGNARFSWDGGLPRVVGGSICASPFRDPLSVHSRYGLRARKVPLQNPLHRGLQPLRYLHDCSHR